MSIFGNISQALFVALSKGLDILIASTFGRPGQPPLTPQAVLTKEPGLTSSEAQQVADLAAAEQAAAAQISELPPGEIHAAEIVPVNEPLGFGKSETDRYFYDVDVWVGTDDGKQGRYIRVTVKAPYPYGKDEIVENAVSEADWRTTESPGEFFKGATKGSIVVTDTVIVSAVRTW